MLVWSLVEPYGYRTMEPEEAAAGLADGSLQNPATGAILHPPGKPMPPIFIVVKGPRLVVDPPCGVCTWRVNDAEPVRTVDGRLVHSLREGDRVQVITDDGRGAEIRA